jgi:type II secretory pathway pseudopilin PulG
VIMIIAMLAALITPAVMQALNSARNAAIKSEIDMLHMAIMNYRSEYGVLPPSLDVLQNDAYVPGGSAAKHLKRLFPRCPDTAGQLNTISQLPSGGRIALTPLSSLTAWLNGFTTDPQSPLVGKRQKLYDFDTSRVNPLTGAYFPSGKRNSPYIYIDSARYVNSTISPPAPWEFADPTNSYFAQRLPVTAVSPPQWNSLAQPAFNPDTFQILCAGRDEIFGNEDDLSNFWPSTRGDYLESLRR